VAKVVLGLASGGAAAWAFLVTMGPADERPGRAEPVIFFDQANDSWLAGIAADPESHVGHAVRIYGVVTGKGRDDAVDVLVESARQADVKQYRHAARMVTSRDRLTLPPVGAHFQADVLVIGDGLGTGDARPTVSVESQRLLPG
jgi:hypothetical protein